LEVTFLRILGIILPSPLKHLIKIIINIAGLRIPTVTISKWKLVAGEVKRTEADEEEEAV
jgi:hypothetical protein